jgi:Tol biopolymer transport system component
VAIETGATETILDEAAPFDVSPDGRWITVAHMGNAGQSILLIDLISGEQRSIVREGEYNTLAMPRFDPSSSKLLFTAAALISQAPAIPAADRVADAVLGLGHAFAHGLPQDIYAVSLRGGTASKLTAIGADEPAVAPSPDGGQVAISTVDALSIMPAGGGRLTALLAPGGYGTVDWAS